MLEGLSIIEEKYKDDQKLRVCIVLYIKLKTDVLFELLTNQTPLFNETDHIVKGKKTRYHPSIIILQDAVSIRITPGTTELMLERQYVGKAT